MKTTSFCLDAQAGWTIPADAAALDSPETMVIAFGAPELTSAHPVFASLRAAFSRSRLVGCSTAGEISGVVVGDASMVVAVTRFERSQVRSASARVDQPGASLEAGSAIGRSLTMPGLRAVFVLSDGLHVNGSELVRGINAQVGAGVVVTGGLAGDGSRFGQTWVIDDGQPRSNVVTAVGLYGPDVRVGHGSRGGWETFGPRRLVTKSAGNVLYELGGRPALGVYRDYLGELASGLPATALLFPLALRRQAGGRELLVRTILSIDEETQAMTFAGDIPEGAEVQLMRTSLESLIDGAAEAAQLTREGVDGAGLSLLISCVGRRLVLGQRTDEEIESARENLPSGTHLIGFYSYGEISPLESGFSDLHNQTMTITTFAEAA